MELDKDLAARQEARELCRRAEEAQRELAKMPQEKLDTIVEAMAAAFSAAAVELAEMAVQETGFGNSADKVIKNRFASETVAKRIRGMKCVGVLQEKTREKLWEVGVPVGVIAAIVPSTNPTSTVCYKALIALKSGNSIVFSPHPKASACTSRAARILAEAAVKAGAPRGSISCLGMASMAGCGELMGAPQVRLILATGGPAMVRAAYSSGKPAIGVGAGNGPAYIHKNADLKSALGCILRSKTFDNGTVCASEQSIIVEKGMEEQLLRTAAPMGFYLMRENEAAALARVLFRENGAMNPEAVGRPAKVLAEMAGFSVPQGTKVLLGREEEAGPTHPYSSEKLCPVLALYGMENEEKILEKVKQVLRHEGAGHTFAIHCPDPETVRKFALEVPVSRVLVNVPAALGGIGAETELFPALTLGCGAVGGSASSNNIGPMDLINIRRVAWGVEAPAARTEADRDLVELLAEKILERLK